LSFGDSLKSFGTVQEALILGLMIVSMFALFYFDFDFTYKIGIAVLAFAIILLVSIASQLLSMQKEAAKAEKT
jgi:predicted cation transporter